MRFATECGMVLLLASSVCLHAEEIAEHAIANDITSTAVDTTKFKVGEFNFELKQKFTNPSYPDEAQLKVIFKEKIIEELSAKNLYSEQGTPLTIDAATTRIFIGEAFGMSKKLGSSNCSFTAHLYTTRAINISGALDLGGGIIQNQKNLFSNLKKAGQQISLQGIEDDSRDFTICAKDLVYKLEKALKK